jgi:hypothetical protein
LSPHLGKSHMGSCRGDRYRSLKHIHQGRSPNIGSRKEIWLGMGNSSTVEHTSRYMWWLNQFQGHL